MIQTSARRSHGPALVVAEQRRHLETGLFEPLDHLRHRSRSGTRGVNFFRVAVLPRPSTNSCSKRVMWFRRSCLTDSISAIGLPLGPRLPRKLTSLRVLVPRRQVGHQLEAERALRASARAALPSASPSARCSSSSDCRMPYGAITSGNDLVGKRQVADVAANQLHPRTAAARGGRACAAAVSIDSDRSMPITVAPVSRHRDRHAPGAATQLEDRRRYLSDAREPPCATDQNAISRRPTVCAFSQS